MDKVSQITRHSEGEARRGLRAIGSTKQAEPGPPRLLRDGLDAGIRWECQNMGRAFTNRATPPRNIGMAGGGVNAMRGEGNVQGSTDHGILFHLLTGYLPSPTAALDDLKDYIEKFTPKTKEAKSVNWWGNRGKIHHELPQGDSWRQGTGRKRLRIFVAPEARRGNGASWLHIFARMYRDQFEGFFAWGQKPRPARARAAGKVREALGKLKWMVNVNLFDNETAFLLERAGD